MSAAPTVLFEMEGNVAVVTLNRPHRGNCIDMELALALRQCAERCRASSVRAVILQGAGKHFCLGGDLRVPDLDDEGMHAYVLTLTRHLNAALLTFLDLSAPVIAVVEGAAAGAGVGLVGAADLAVAADSAYFTLAFTAVGMTPDTGTSLWLTETLGRKRALELTLLNRRLSAAEALAWGLVNRVVAEGQCRREALQLAETLAQGPLQSFGAAKRLVGPTFADLEARLEAEAQSIAARRISPEGREGIRSYLAQRAPDFISHPGAVEP
jgi:2-(1,2-epoxy-1,2-dihydrophenyl)acetyl-CoA isomerase